VRSALNRLPPPSRIFVGVLLVAGTGASRPAVGQTAANAALPATVAQFDEWSGQIKKALFIQDPLPLLAPRSYGTFSPAKGVVAERVTYGTNYGMRVPAIVYRPSHAKGRLPGLVIVNGHTGDKTSWYAFYAGILYARAGAVVVTYDLVGERRAQQRPEIRDQCTR